MTKNFFITTPIYYPSGKPHMGHAYSSILTDIIARFKRLEGYKVFFLTGTDEHGLKIQKSAEKENKIPIDFCNEVSEVFKNLSNQLNLSNTDFIRTTEDRHKKVVQQLWGILSKKDQIYLSKYSGWYSISDEAYYTEEEVIFAALHHDLGQVGDLENDYYVPNDSKWHIENQGKYYKRGKDLNFMTVTDRAIYLLNHFGLTMSENEYLALRLRLF